MYILKRKWKGMWTYDSENHCPCSSWRGVCDDESVDDGDSEDTQDQHDLDDMDCGYEGRHLEMLWKA